MAATAPAAVLHSAAAAGHLAANPALITVSTDHGSCASASAPPMASQSLVSQAKNYLSPLTNFSKFH